MRSKIVRGALAGIVAAIPMGVAMHLLGVTTPLGDRMPMAHMIAKILGLPLVVVWMGHVLISAGIGACFGWWFGNRVRGIGSGLGWGAVHAIIWWAVRVLVILPLVMDLPPLAPLVRPALRSIAISGLLAHLVYGFTLALAYVWLLRARPGVPAESRT